MKPWKLLHCGRCCKVAPALRRSLSDGVDGKLLPHTAVGPCTPRHGVILQLPPSFIKIPLGWSVFIQEAIVFVLLKKEHTFCFWQLTLDVSNNCLFVCLFVDRFDLNQPCVVLPTTISCSCARLIPEWAAAQGLTSHWVTQGQLSVGVDSALYKQLQILITLKSAASKSLRQLLLFLSAAQPGSDGEERLETWERLQDKPAARGGSQGPSEDCWRGTSTPGPLFSAGNLGHQPCGGSFPAPPLWWWRGQQWVSVPLPKHYLGTRKLLWTKQCFICTFIHKYFCSTFPTFTQLHFSHTPQGFKCSSSLRCSSFKAVWELYIYMHGPTGTRGSGKPSLTHSLPVCASKRANKKFTPCREVNLQSCSARCSPSSPKLPHHEKRMFPSTPRSQIWGERRSKGSPQTYSPMCDRAPNQNQHGFT